MARDFPARVDPWDLVRGRRGFSGTLPLAGFSRLADLIVSGEGGEASFELQFGADDIGTSYVDVEVSARPVLLCQRTLEPFTFALERRVRLGLIQAAEDEAGLPPGYEPLLVPDEPLSLADLVEDELILGLPLVPRRGDHPVDANFGPTEVATEEQESPFAALKALKRDDGKS